jgi:pyruvate dehydrogenase E1 component alpha subunit
MAELLGRVTGTSKGMGGSMHFLKGTPFYGGHGIVEANSSRGWTSFADKYFETGV